jgi:hypothetical protein
VLAVRLLPTGSFDENVQESLGKIMKEGAPFKPEIVARMAKALKDKEAGDGTKATAATAATSSTTAPKPAAAETPAPKSATTAD